MKFFAGLVSSPLCHNLSVLGDSSPSSYHHHVEKEFSPLISKP
ncbi:unnamed protein product [Arabidopsis halleri]